MPFETMHEAVAAIGKAAGIDRLEPDANGNIKLVINGALPVFVQEVSDDEMEVQAHVEGLGPQLSDAEMQAIFEANLNDSEGRLAIDPDTGRVVYGGRIRVTLHDETSLLAAVDRLIVEAAQWNTDRLATLKAAARQVGDSDRDVLSETVLRA